MAMKTKALRVRVTVAKIGNREIPDGPKQVKIQYPLPERLDNPAEVIKMFQQFKDWGKEVTDNASDDDTPIYWADKPPRFDEILIEGLKLAARRVGQRRIADEVRESSPPRRAGRGVNAYEVLEA